MKIQVWNQGTPELSDLGRDENGKDIPMEFYGIGEIYVTDDLETLVIMNDSKTDISIDLTFDSNEDMAVFADKLYEAVNPHG